MICMTTKPTRQTDSDHNGNPGEDPISSVKVSKKTRKLLLAVSRLAGMTAVHHFMTKFFDPKLQELVEKGIIEDEEIMTTLFSSAKKK